MLILPVYAHQFTGCCLPLSTCIPAKDMRDAGRVDVLSRGSQDLLGHADEDVTDSYVRPELEDVIAALNRAARLIDGEQVDNVVQFGSSNSNGTTNGTVASEAV